MSVGHAVFRWSALLLTITTLAGCGAGSAPAAPSSVERAAEATQSAATRTVQHAMGTTEVPATPQRVVVLDTGELDTALALGVKPVGAVEAIAGEGYQAYFGDLTEGIENVGTIAEPNLETIAALDPDLILSNKVRHEDIYEQLSQIAPTVFAERVGVAWKDNFTLGAEALGKTTEAERLMQQYDQRVADLRATLGDPAATEVSVVRFLPEQIRLYQRGSFIGTILDDVGFARPASQQATDETFLEGNKERIGDLDGDKLFVTYYGDETATVVNAFKADPLWAQLDAVQNNDVYDVSDDHWMLGIGMLAANRVLDDLETLLAGGSATPPTTATTEAGGTRTITHALGDTEIPANPQRVVALDWGGLGNYIALDARPVGAAIIAPESIGYLGDAVTGIEDVAPGTGEANLETILPLKPDLIIATQAEEPVYAELSRIAPTVIAPTWPDEDWQAHLRFVADALGRAAAAEELLRDYEARIDEFKRAMGDRLDQTTVSIVRSDTENVIVLLPQTFAGSVVADAGLARPTGQQAEAAEGADIFRRISLELIPELDAEAIFWMQRNKQEGAGMQQVQAHPLWSRLSAVQRGNVHEVSIDTWGVGYNVVGANRTLDDLWTHLVQQ